MVAVTQPEQTSELIRDATTRRTVPVHDSSATDLDRCVASDLDQVGVSCATGVLDAREVLEYSSLLDRHVAADAALLPPERYDQEFGRVLFLPHYDSRYLDLLSMDQVVGPCDHVLGGDCTLYTMTSACQLPGGSGRPIHVDTSIAVPDYLAGVGVLVLLDDFSVTSGATRFHPVDRIEPPTSKEFEDAALVLEAPAGSVCWFRGRLWHDALPNLGDTWRRTIILAFVRPWIRQRFDIARMIGSKPEVLDERVRQKLGFDLLPPGSHEEYYMPPNERRSVLLKRAGWP